MAMKVASLIITLLMFSAIASQESQRTQAERVVLDTPGVITLKLAPLRRRVSAAGVYQPLIGPFDPESKIRFALVATNTSLIPLVVRTWDYRAQNRPRLLRDNQEVPYREGLSDLVKQKDAEIGGIISIVAVTLEPNHEKTLEYLDLSDWYEPLQPGHYQLSTQHRFIQGGKLVDSASITFEVKPKDSQPQ